MILKYTLVAALVFGAVLLAVRWQSAADPAAGNARLAQRVLKAVAEEDYAAFVAQADRSVRKLLVEDFQALAQRHAPRLRHGHELRPLEERWRGAVHVNRWQVLFKDGGSSAVLMLGVRDGKVASFAMY